MLILTLFYAMYLLAWRIYNDERVYKITSIIAIIGIINVPIIKYSVDWWNTLHQPASINILSKSTIHSSMLVPLLIMTAAFALFSLLIFLMIRRPPRSTLSSSSAASDVYKRQN